MTTPDTAELRAAAERIMAFAIRKLDKATDHSTRVGLGEMYDVARAYLAAVEENKRLRELLERANASGIYLDGDLRREINAALSTKPAAGQ